MLDKDIALRLDEDFLYILNFLKHSLDAFKDDEESTKLSNQWLEKLCGESYENVQAKRLRNNYLSKLVNSFQSKVLNEPFKKSPPKGHLKPTEPMEKAEADPEWLNALIEEAKTNMPASSTKDCQTYISSKVFEQNKGACAYIAVAVADEGEVPQWIKIGDDLDNYDQHLETIFSRMTIAEKDPDGMKPAETEKGRELHQEIIEAIDNELCNISEPGIYEPLESMVTQYIDYIKGSKLSEEASDLNGVKLRQFLLMQLRGELLVDQVD